MNILNVVAILINYLLRVPGIVIAVTIHEFVRALVSTRLGDLLPREGGRLTFNPFKQMDAIGFFLLLFFGFGWGNPVRTSPTYYRNRRVGTLLTYATPIVINIIIAMFMFLAYQFIAMGGMTQTVPALSVISSIFAYAAVYNLTYGIFNLIPVYPLAGSKLLSVFVSPGTSVKFAQYEKVLQIVLVFLIAFNMFNFITDLAVWVFDLSARLF